MTRESILEQLQESVPQFRVNPEWVDESLGYPAINDFGRYICAEAEATQWDEVRKSMLFLERALTEGDGYVHDLVFECLDTLASCQSIESLKGYFGAKTLALWKETAALKRSATKDGARTGLVVRKLHARKVSARHVAQAERENLRRS